MHRRRRRRRRNVVPLLFSCIVLAAVVALAVYYLSPQNGGDNADLSMPPTSTAPTGGEDPGTTPSVSPTPMIVVEVNRGNAKVVVASLERPGDYSCVWDVTLMYEGGSASAERKVWARDGYTRVERYPFGGGKLLQTTIIGNEKAYLWSPDGQYYEGQQATFTGDAEARVPSIDELLEMDDERIVDASYVVLDGTIPCAYIETEQKDSDYRDFWWIALDSGLLVKAEAKEKDTLIYRAVLRDLTLERPGDSFFTLPDGTILPG